MNAYPKNPLLTFTLCLLAFVTSVAAYAADADHTFTVTEGASPWQDRVGQWSLTNVPADLNGNGPLPQGDCGSRSLDVPGKPASILIGVQENDVAKFTGICPTAKDTGEKIGVKDAEGNILPYDIYKLPNPPEHIDGANVFGAGLLLLKIEAAAAPAASPASSPTPAVKPQAVRTNLKSFKLAANAKLAPIRDAGLFVA